MTIPANAKQCLACGGVIPEESPLCPMCPDPRIANLESELAQARAEIERLRGELEQPWKHSEHWRTPETGQVECECCCSWALDTEKLVKEFATLRAQLEQMCRPVTDEEWAESHWTEDGGMRGFVDSFIAARARRQEKP